MREIICLNIGQAGIQVGNSMWQLFALQHGIHQNSQRQRATRGSEQNELFDDSSQTFFTETQAGKYVARSIMVDLQPNVIDEIRTSAYRQMFNRDTLISGKQDAANNYARGKYTLGNGMIDLTMDKIRKLADSCNDFQGFMVFHSMSGGTGSGFGSLLMERLSIDYGKKPKMSFSIYPSQKMSTSTVEPYNAVLSTSALMEHSNVTVVLDNQALYDITRKNLDFQRPTYTIFNQITSQVVSSLTASLRFDGTLNVDLCEFQTNLVPFPRFHFMQTGYSPISSTQRSCWKNPMFAKQITFQVFQPTNQMVKCNPHNGKYMACALMYRGDVIPKDVNNSIQAITSQRTIRFVDWSSGGYKLGINYQAPTVLPGGDLGKNMRACCMIGNTTSIAEIFSKIDHKFDLMYARRAFVHWYCREGIELDEFPEARQNLAVLQKDYQEAGFQSVDEEEYE